MLRRLLFSVTLFLAAAITACDRAPTEPRLRGLVDLIAANEKGTTASASSTLPALLSQAVAKLEKEEGHVGVETAFADWTKLQDQLQAQVVASDRSAVQAKLAAIHAEELRIVLRELGQSVVTRVLSETNVGMAEAGALIVNAQAAGEDMSRALTIAQQVRRTSAAASKALAADEYVKALDLATQSASLLNGLTYFLVELRRIDGIEALYPRAVGQIASTKGAAAADALTADVKVLDAAARTALRSANRSTAQAKLSAVRAEQIQVVLDVLGERAATTLVERVATRISQTRAVLSELDRSGRDVARYQRMLREANDLNVRAATAISKGDPATALDLGSHAAGLLNALQHLTR